MLHHHLVGGSKLLLDKHKQRSLLVVQYNTSFRGGYTVLAGPIRRARMAMLCPCVRVFRAADDGMASTITIMMIILHNQRLHLHAVLGLSLYPRNVLLGDGVPCAHVLLHAGREASLLALGQRCAGLGDAALEAVLVEFLGARSAGVLQRAKHQSD
jgi:hypothetical protein